MEKIREHLDYGDLEKEIETLWGFLEAEKFHLVYEHCQSILRAIESDLADDFGRDLDSATLYDDSNTRRRTCYLETLRVYRRAIDGGIIGIILETDDMKDVNPNWQQYHSLRETILNEIYKVTYLLGQDYPDKTFITTAELEKRDESFRDHCRFLLKGEFFQKFKTVIEILGDLDRKDFHKVTEPYKNLRERCYECLEILEIMQDGRFFGEFDTFIEDYERDVHIYLQILWYLALKTDLNKADKFLNPNTYKGGLDIQVQVFAAISLLEDVIPHLKEARQHGLRDQPAIVILEEYTEYLYKILIHEESHTGAGELRQILETERILSQDGFPDNYQTLDLRAPEEKRHIIEETYRSLQEHQLIYCQMIQDNSTEYLAQDALQEFEDLLEKAARGIGVREKPVEDEEQQQKNNRMVYRYEFKKSSREREPVVFSMKSERGQTTEIRVLHNEWVEDLYAAWKESKKLQYMQGIIDGYTQTQEKIKYRMDFAIKFFRKKWFAFRLTEHKRIPVKNPEGRVFRQHVTVTQVMQNLQSSLFSDFFGDLKMRYRSRSGVKLQRLRWEWFAERELHTEHFEKTKYNYMKYIHTRWKEKVKEHYETLRKLSRREEEHND